MSVNRDVIIQYLLINILYIQVIQVDCARQRLTSVSHHLVLVISVHVGQFWVVISVTVLMASPG